MSHGEPCRSFACCLHVGAKFWQTLATSGKLWQTLAESGKQLQTLANLHLTLDPLIEDPHFGLMRKGLSDQVYLAFRE